MWCCITPERVEKTDRIMRALAQGTNGCRIFGEPPDDGEPFAVWGHKWLGERIVPKAHHSGRPYWFVDNGYWKSARGLSDGYYSITYRGLWPVELPNPDMKRLRVDMHSWVNRPQGYVLLALPGMGYGGMLGFDMVAWSHQVRAEIARHTGKRIVVRDKRSRRPLVQDLNGAAVLVTHSSKVAVDAVIAGVPAIVAPTNPAAPVCSTSMADIENPPKPDREKWFASLACQQFTLAEMAKGVAAYWMDAIKEVVDAPRAVHEGLRLEAAAIGDAVLQGGPDLHGHDALRSQSEGKGLCGLG